ncbi:MAG: amidohydrolase family protein [Terriglobales bacterium]
MRLGRCSALCVSLLVVLFVSLPSLFAQQPAPLSPLVLKYVRVNSPKTILEHVRVIDGTGRAAIEDQNIVIENGKITAIQPGTDSSAGAGSNSLNLRGYTVIPGIVGMHNHLFYVGRPNLDPSWKFEMPVAVPQMTFSAPRLYLAGGVTTMRTTGSVETYADLNLKRDIDAGQLPGPHLDVTGPYLEGPHSYFIQMHELSGPQEARDLVNYWADRGVTSYKAYMNITRAELKAAIDAAHTRGLKVTGHLCSVTYEEAAALGIDDLEHGFFVNTQLDPDKKPDECSSSAGDYTLEHMVSDGPEAKALISSLVQHHVAVTSTLPVFEGDITGRPPLRHAVLDAMTPEARQDYLYLRKRPADKPSKHDGAMLLRRDMDLEREFVAAGGLLLAGPDPTGNGGVVPGYGDQREIELLVEAGFSPVEAIKIATLNGATYLGRQDRIGSIAAGKNADLVVIKGDPSTHIADIENVEIVFKDGVGYDSQKLADSVKGRYGEY